MDFKHLFDFLTELQQNNAKSWMDAHRRRYQDLRWQFMRWLEATDQQLSALDPDYYHTPANKAVNRINNNLMFHPDRPVYKDHFGAGLDKAPGTADFYIQIGPGNSLLAGGLWRPEPKKLRSLREAIDYNGEELQAILSRKSFVRTFGGLYEDEALQTAPKGFTADHPHINLLRQKTLAVVHPLEPGQVLAPDFQEYIAQVYLEMLPFRHYLNQALTV